MGEIENIRDLVGLWPTRACLAADMQSVAEHLSVTTSRVHKWAEVGAIPAKYHYTFLRAAKDRGYDVSAEFLISLHHPVVQKIEAAA